MKSVYIVCSNKIYKFLIKNIFSLKKDPKSSDFFFGQEKGPVISNPSWHEIEHVSHHHGFKREARHAALDDV